MRRNSTRPLKYSPLQTESKEAARTHDRVPHSVMSLLTGFLYYSLDLTGPKCGIDEDLTLRKSLSRTLSVTANTYASTVPFLAPACFSRVNQPS
jgi:hypothetical protein